MHKARLACRFLEPRSVAVDGAAMEICTRQYPIKFETGNLSSYNLFSRYRFVMIILDQPCKRLEWKLGIRIFPCRKWPSSLKTPELSTRMSLIILCYRSHRAGPRTQVQKEATRERKLGEPCIKQRELTKHRK